MVPCTHVAALLRGGFTRLVCCFLLLPRKFLFDKKNISLQAKEQFEASAKALWLETLALAKALRPHGP